MPQPKRALRFLGARSVSRIGSLLAWLALAAVTAGAQTISPVIVEYREKAQGKFQLTNDSDFPLFVVLEPQSFSVDKEGNPTFRTLDPGIHVSLSTMSFRLAPKQVYTVFYRGSADRLPAWFVIYATITGKTTPTGIKIALELPHTVYLLTKKPLAREDVVWLRADVLSDKKQIEAEVENRGGEISRVLEVEVASPAAKKEYSGFPLFPGQRRAMQLDWDQPGEPQRIVLKFERFKTESAIRRVTPSP